MLARPKRRVRKPSTWKKKQYKMFCYCRDLMGKRTTGISPVIFMLMNLKLFLETQLAGKYKMSGAVIFYRISEQVNVQKLYKCSVMYIQ